MPDIRSTIIAKSDQQNFDDFADGPRTFTITKVDVYDRPEQPVVIHLAEAPGKPYKPSKGMRRVIAKGWGGESDNYVGKRITLYGDPTVKWAGKEAGGIKVAAMSSIDAPFDLLVAESQKKRVFHKVEKLPDVAPQQQHDLSDRIGKAITAFAQLGTTQDDLEQRIGRPASEWTGDDLQQLMGYYAEKNTPAVDTATGEVLDGEQA